MSLMHLKELEALSPTERQHLQQLEETFQDALLASQLKAKSSHLEPELLARASVTLILAFAARHAVDSVDDVTPEAFGAVAAEMIGWAVDRTKRRPTIWH